MVFYIGANGVLNQLDLQIYVLLKTLNQYNPWMNISSQQKFLCIWIFSSRSLGFCCCLCFDNPKE